MILPHKCDYIMTIEKTDEMMKRIRMYLDFLRTEDEFKGKSIYQVCEDLVVKKFKEVSDKKILMLL